MTTTSLQDAENPTRGAGPWWLFLLTGIAWIIISFVLLAFKPGAVTTIGFLVGFVLLFGGIAEFVALGYVDSWKWVHVVLGVLLLIAGVLALMQPFQTFGILAQLIGWFLLFKGLFDVLVSIIDRRAIHLWGLLLACGLAEMAIGVWAIGYPGRSAWLLIVWVGIGALLRGIGDIVTAFAIHSHRGGGTLAAA